MMKLFAMSPLEDETSIDPDERIAFLTYVLSVSEKSRKNVVVLIEDNVSTNKSIANKQNIPLIGFASHMLNLAVKDIICDHKEVLGKIHRLMVKLKKPLQRARLNKVTDLS